MSSKDWINCKDTVMKVAGGSTLENLKNSANINVAVVKPQRYKIKYQ